MSLVECFQPVCIMDLFRPRCIHLQRATDQGGNLMISFPTAAFRLTLALLLGALVGLERERGERAAGIRTHALVALGSCLVMLVSTFGVADILRTLSVVPA